MRDLEDVAERVAHHRPSVAIRRVERGLQRDRPGVDRSAVGRVGIVDVHVEEGREQIALRSAHLIDRVTDVDLGRTLGLDRTVASNTARRKSTCAATSLATIRGVTE